MVVNAQPIVIKSDVTKGCDSLSVYFTFTSTISPITTIKWDFGGGVTNSSATPTIKYSVPGVYSVKLIINGTDSITENNFVEIKACDSLIVPNVFTPNDDGFNDDFKVISSGKSALQLRIFAPTGILVYKSVAMNLKWDGRLPSGEKVLPGVYYYTIENVDAVHPIKKSGFFYIYW